MKAVLLLEDGSLFEGVPIGAAGERIGKIVLNTAVVGYQEIATDPTNAGKIIVLTYPLIGNYGVAEKFYESRKSWASGIAIKESSRIYSNWQAEASFESFLKNENLTAISELDTRTLAVTIRDKGELFGILSTKTFDKDKLTCRLEKEKDSITNDFIKDISVKKITTIDGHKNGAKIGVLDIGMLNSFLKQLNTLGCHVTLIPYDTNAEAILSMNLDGLVISNGPEEDIAIPKIVKTVKALLGKVPILGISTGHEILGLALGGKLERMKIGHHGVNYPVIAPHSLKGEITAQNHSWVISNESIWNKKDVTITLRNVNDKSIEEMESKALKFISTQYYPVSPGFDEVNTAFMRFLKIAAPGKLHKKTHNPTSKRAVRRFGKLTAALSKAEGQAHRCPERSRREVEYAKA